MNLAFITLKQHGYITFIEFNQPAVFETSVCCNQMQWIIIMADGNQGFYPIFSQLQENILIELQALFVWFCLISIRKNAGPADRHSEYFKSHFAHQTNILFIMMIKINTGQCRIIPSIFKGKIGYLPKHIGKSVCSLGNYIHAGQSPSTFPVSSFYLVRCSGATPQKCVRKSVHAAASFSACSCL